MRSLQGRTQLFVGLGDTRPPRAYVGTKTLTSPITSSPKGDTHTHGSRYAQKANFTLPVEDTVFITTSLTI